MLFLWNHIRDISWNSSLPLLLLVTKLPPQAMSLLQFRVLQVQLVFLRVCKTDP